MESKRLDFLDIAKGIGIIFVLYSHSCGFPVFGNAVTAFYMPLFFFISGYVYKTGRSAGENIKRKLKQLLIPYVGFTLLLYAEHIFLAIIKHELTRENIIMPLLGAIYSRGALYAEFSRNDTFFFLISNNPMWFITAMAVSCVIFYLLVENFLANKKKRIIITVLLTGITIGFSYCPYLLPWSIDTAFAGALFMLLGAFLGQMSYYSDENKSRFSPVFVILAGLVYCVLTEIAKPINMSIRDYGYSGIVGAMWFLMAALTGTIIFLWLCRYIEKFKFTRVFSMVGKHTYTIMALHFIFIKYLEKSYYLFHMTFEYSRESVLYWVYWTVILAAVTGLCILFDYILGFVKSKLFRGK